MVTGASTASLALLLVDARKGVLEQTRRHALLSSLLRVPAPDPLRQQNGPGRLRPGDLRGDPRGLHHLRRQARDHRPRLRPDLRPGGRQRGRALDQHALVRRAAAAGPARGRPHRLRPQPGRQPLPGPVRDPAAVGRAPRLPRLRRLGRRRHLQAGRRGDGPALAQDLDDLPDRHPRRRRRPGLPADGGDDAARRRARHLPRRHDLPPLQPAERQPPLRGDDLLVRRDLLAAHRGAVPAQAHDPLDPRRSRDAALRAQRRHPAPRPRRGDARGQRHRPGLDPHHLAALLRRVPAQPHHRQLHPRRPRHQPHRRRRDDHRRRRRAGAPATALGRRREHHLPPQQPLPRGTPRGAGHRAARRSG